VPLSLTTANNRGDGLAVVIPRQSHSGDDGGGNDYRGREAILHGMNPTILSSEAISEALFY